jgi:uncharacterized membrane protein
MTVAVCLRCGALKHGAFVSCPKCHYAPDDDESLTRHLLATDHYFSREQLEAISERAKTGMPVEFPSEMLEEAGVSKEQLDAEQKQLGRGCIGFAALVVLLVVIFLVI